MTLLEFLVDAFGEIGFGGALGYYWERFYTKKPARGYNPDARFLPIYGVGAVISKYTPWWVIPGAVTSLEFVTSKKFDPDKRLWNYSSCAGNLQGRICIKSILAFSAACIAYHFFPVTNHVPKAVKGVFSFYGLSKVIQVSSTSSVPKLEFKTNISRF